ncbi:hypothetical protein [uncultured Gilvimarinus sp.]|uniref:hypothetical protein n=1 Tax=uncultured Gilvimarinus sp. TaxID=1689143 RepID=UPI0030DC8FBF
MANVTDFTVPLAKRLNALNQVVTEMRKERHPVANVHTTNTEVFVFLRPHDDNQRIGGETCGFEHSAQGLVRWYERISKVSGVRVHVRWAVKDNDVMVPPDLLRRVH